MGLLMANSGVGHLSKGHRDSVAPCPKIHHQMRRAIDQSACRFSDEIHENAPVESASIESVLRRLAYATATSIRTVPSCLRLGTARPSGHESLVLAERVSRGFATGRSG